MQPFNPYQQDEPMNDRGLPGDRGRQFAQPEEQQIPMEAIQPGMSYTGDNMNPDVNMSQRETEDMSQFKLDGSRILDNLQKSLMGFIYDPNHCKWKRIAEPLLSPLGVGRIIQILNFSMGNIDHRLSKWGIDSINESLFLFRRNLRHELMLNPIYRINPKEELPVSTIRIVLEECYGCKESLLKRSLDGFTVRETGHSESHSYVHNPNQGGSRFPNIFK